MAKSLNELSTCLWSSPNPSERSAIMGATGRMVPRRGPGSPFGQRQAFACTRVPDHRRPVIPIDPKGVHAGGPRPKWRSGSIEP